MPTSVERRCYAVLGMILASACGGTPTSPSSNESAVNSPPVIVRFKVQGTRTREPANFADLTEQIPVSVDVTDAESAITNLQFNWSSSLGTFSGNGPAVTWRAPANAATPVTVNLNLEVVERYTADGKTQKTLENKVTSSTTVSLHNSMQEIGDMARQFLLDFSDSSIKDVPYIMRNFEPTCYGTDSETRDVAKNRAEFSIVEWRVDQPVTTVQFGGLCPVRSLAGDGCAQVRSYWKSMARKDLFKASGDLYLKAGQADVQNGVDQVAAMYYPGQQRWKLCDSAWKPD